MQRAHATRNRKNQSGFTLLEIAIVLVIVGLIIGGVLVGRELIKASEIRGVISQYEQFKTAINTFLLKYGALPGDIRPAEAAAYGFFQFNTAASGRGDNNGFISGNCINESLVFWRHLGEAGLINGNFGTTGSNALSTVTGVVTATNSNVGQSLPQSRLAGNYYVAYSDNNTSSYGRQNMFLVQAITAVNSTGSCSSNFTLKPLDLSTIDTKIDDGLAFVGIVRGQGAWAATPAANNCVYGGTGIFNPENMYNISGDYGTRPVCYGYLFF